MTNENSSKALADELANARNEIVLTIAFLGRDAGTERLPGTIDGLIKRLAAADKAILAALRPPSPYSGAALADELVREVALAICKSRTCEGSSCCQWPANMGRVNCNAKAGAYDHAARDAIAIWNARSPSPYSGAAREQAAQQILAAIRKVRDEYADQANFADIDAAVYFREFVRRLDLAVAGKSGNEVPPWGGTSSLSSPTTLPRDAERETIERCAQEAERLSEKPGWSPGYKNASREIAKCIRALPSIPPREGVERGASSPTWQECVDIATQYDDCGGLFIAEKIRDRALSLSPTSVMPDEGKQE